MTISKKAASIELRPDGWERFQRAVSVAAKSGPKHRPEKRKVNARKRHVSHKR